MKLEIISRYPSVATHSTPLLFVHGMLHAAWCWEAHFLDCFAQQGFAAHAVNLRGHGNSEGRDNLRWTRIADFVEDVANAAQQLPAPPVLIGHSMGGFIIEKYLEEHSAPAAVLLTTPPPSGLFKAALRLARRHPTLFAKINLTLSLVPLVATPELARQAFFSEDLSDEELRQYWEQMEDDAFLAFLDMVVLDLPKPPKVRIPVLVIGAGRDNMLKPTEIESLATAYDADVEILPNAAHSVMLGSQWQTAAERILVWLEQWEARAIAPVGRDLGNISSKHEGEVRPTG